MKKIISLLILLIGALLIYADVQGITEAELYITGWSNPDGVCNHATIGVGYFGYAVTEDEPGYDWIGVTAHDGAGVALSSFTVRYPVNNTIDSIGQGEWPSLSLAGLITRPVLLRLYDLITPNDFAGAQLLVTIALDPAYTASGGIMIADCLLLPMVVTGYEVGIQPSARGVDMLGASARVILYNESAVNTDPSWGVDIWIVDENGQGYKAFYISTDDITTLSAFPASNLLIKSTPDGYATFWKLTTGEYQLNIGPDSNGNVQVIIYDTIPPTKVYRADFDITPQELP